MSDSTWLIGRCSAAAVIERVLVLAEASSAPLLFPFVISERAARFLFWHSVSDAFRHRVRWSSSPTPTSLARMQGARANFCQHRNLMRSKDVGRYPLDPAHMGSSKFKTRHTQTSSSGNIDMSSFDLAAYLRPVRQPFSSTDRHRSGATGALVSTELPPVAQSTAGICSIRLRATPCPAVLAKRIGTAAGAAGAHILAGRLRSSTNTGPLQTLHYIANTLSCARANAAEVDGRTGIEHRASVEAM